MALWSVERDERAPGPPRDACYSQGHAPTHLGRNVTPRMRKFLDHDAQAIPTHFPRLMTEVAVEQGADRAVLLDGTGISPAMFQSPEARISARQYARLATNALRLTGNSGLGIDLGRRVQLSNLGMLGLAAMSSPDMKTALELGIRYYRLLAPFWDLSLEAEGDVLRVTAREAISLHPLHMLATEILLVTFLSASRALLGRELPCREVRLDYPEPPHAARYAEIFSSAPVLFEQPLLQLAVDAAIMDQKVLSSDPVTARVAERQCATSLSPSLSPEGLLAKVRRMLEAKPGRYPGPDNVAEALQTSPRTLRRSLDEMGTSYQELVDAARCKHATDLLTATDMSINEIAERLGFSEGRALRRAFKRWTGSTAAKYRQEKGTPPSARRAHR
jgi:AraC-like DNA-binding protein